MSTLHEKTRAIYKKQHERISNNENAFSRIKNMYTDETFSLPKDWFKGKAAIDIGCGNVGALPIYLMQNGISKFYGVDIGNEWMDGLAQNISEYGEFELKEGSVLDIPYNDNSFDFVSINGVLIHLANLDEVNKGFNEGARVCKSGGYYYTSYGPCGGLIQGVILPAIREYYQSADKDGNKEAKEFKKFIDTINPYILQETFKMMVDTSKLHSGEDLNYSFLESLFGEDFCVFIQNFIQTPTWLSNETTPTFVENKYKECGFTNIRRVTRYIQRTDIRKYFAPLHYNLDSYMSKLLYGEGYVTYIGQKI